MTLIPGLFRPVLFLVNAGPTPKKPRKDMFWSDLLFDWCSVLQVGAPYTNIDSAVTIWLGTADIPEGLHEASGSPVLLEGSAAFRENWCITSRIEPPVRGHR